MTILNITKKFVHGITLVYSTALVCIVINLKFTLGREKLLCYFVCMHKSTLNEIFPRCKVVYVPVLKHCDFKHANLH